MVFNATVNNISVISLVSFIGGGNPSAWRTPPTCHKSLTNFTIYILQLMKFGKVKIRWQVIFCDTFVSHEGGKKEGILTTTTIGTYLWSSATHTFRNRS